MSDEITGTTNIGRPVFVYGEANTHVWGNPVGVDLPFYCTVSPRRWWHRLMFWHRSKADQWTPEQLAVLEAQNVLPLEINRVAKFYMPPRPNPDTPTR